LNIYIYGSRNFKKEIHEVLNRSKIRLKLDDETLISDIDSLEELKEIIKNEPEELYLIDNSKIVTKKSLSNKIKFLTPKGAIEEDFLSEHGVAELSINSLDELPKYILKKYEERKDKTEYDNPKIIPPEDYFHEISTPSMELDDELAMLLSNEESSKQEIDELKNETLDDIFSFDNDSNNLENMIGEIDEEDDFQTNISDDFNDSFGLNNISFDYDDKEIMNEENIQDAGILDNISESEIDNFKLDEDNSFEEIFEDKNFLNDSILENENIKIEENNYLKEKNMIEDDFSELDSLNERDILEALNQTGSSIGEFTNSFPDQKSVSSNKDISSIQVSNGANVSDLAQLLSNLLSNKTVEITIKIKD